MGGREAEKRTKKGMERNYTELGEWSQKKGEERYIKQFGINKKGCKQEKEKCRKEKRWERVEAREEQKIGKKSRKREFGPGRLERKGKKIGGRTLMILRREGSNQPKLGKVTFENIKA